MFDKVDEFVKWFEVDACQLSVQRQLRLLSTAFQVAIYLRPAERLPPALLLLPPEALRLAEAPVLRVAEAPTLRVAEAPVLRVAEAPTLRLADPLVLRWLAVVRVEETVEALRLPVL